MTELPAYGNWQDVPDTLKTRTALKQMGLKLARGQQPKAIKTHWDYKIPDYLLYEVSEAVPNVVSEKQKAALEKAKAASLAARACTKCGYVEELSKDYRGKVYVRGGLCPHCRHLERRAEDKDAAIAWARQILTRSDVLILDTETTDLWGEVIELAMIDLAGNAIYNSRFKPVSEITAGARAVHGITSEMLESAPLFAEQYETIGAILERAGLVLIYNAAYDRFCLQHTARLYELKKPLVFELECLMIQYAAFCNEWSSSHKDYRYQPLGGGHDALGDCRAALAVLHEIAKG